MRASLILFAFLAAVSSVGSAQTLYREASGTPASLYCISFADESHGLAAGSGGVITSTQDSGRTWMNYPQGTTNFRCALFNDSTSGAIAGDGGQIVAEISGSLVPDQLPESKPIYGITYSTYDTAVVVGGSGLIYITRDSGKTWSKIHPPPLLASHNFYGVDYFDDSTYLIVGAGGVMIYTEDAGTTWQRIVVPTTRDLYSIVFPDTSSNGWVVGDQTILYTRDGGTTWTSVPTTDSLRQVTGYDSLHGYAVGLHGTLLSTSDLVHWSAIPTGTTANLYGVDIPDSLYIAGDSGIIMTTLAPPPPPTPFFTVQDIDFGSVHLGGSLHDSLRLMNPGPVPVSVTNIFIDKPEFAFDHPPAFPMTIKAFDSVVLAMTFTPTHASYDSAVVRAAAVDALPQAATLIGYGLPSNAVKAAESSATWISIVSGNRSASISIPEVLQIPAHLVVFDVLGVDRAEIDLTGPIVEIPSLAAGAYFFRLSTSGVAVSGRFLLE